MKAQSDRTPDDPASRRLPGRRGHLPLRVAPMLLVGLILLVLGVLSTAFL